MSPPKSPTEAEVSPPKVALPIFRGAPRPLPIIHVYGPARRAKADIELIHRAPFSGRPTSVTFRVNRRALADKSYYFLKLVCSGKWKDGFGEEEKIKCDFKADEFKYLMDLVYGNTTETKHCDCSGGNLIGLWSKYNGVLHLAEKLGMKKLVSGSLENDLARPECPNAKECPVQSLHALFAVTHDLTFLKRASNPGKVTVQTILDGPLKELDYKISAENLDWLHGLE